MPTPKFMQAPLIDEDEEKKNKPRFLQAPLVGEDEPKKTKGTFAQRLGFGGTQEQRTFFGLPQELESQVFPRAIKTREKALEDKKISAKEFLQGAASGITDLLSLPGRATAASPTLLPGGEKFTEAIKRKKAPEKSGAIRKVAESVVRDPAAIPVGLATAGLGPLLKASKVPAALAGGAEGAVAAGTKQVEEFGETGKIDPVRAAAEIGISAVTAGALNKLSPVLKKRAAKFMTNILKPKQKAGLMGFDAEDIFKLKVDGTVNQTIKRAGDKASTLTKEVDGIVSDFVKNNPEKKVYSNEIFSNTLKNIQKGNEKTILAGEGKAATSAIKNIFEELQTRGALGDLDAKGLRKLKNELGKIAFKKTTALTDDDVVKRKAAKLIWKDVAESFYDFVPDAAPKSKNIHTLKTIKNTAEDAAERIGKKNAVSLRDLMVLSAGGATVPLVGPVPAAVAVGGIGAKKFLETGRGPQLLRAAGEAVGKPGAQMGASIAAGKTLSELLAQRKKKEKKEKEEEEKKGKKDLIIKALRSGGGRRF